MGIKWNHRDTKLYFWYGLQTWSNISNHRIGGVWLQLMNEIKEFARKGTDNYIAVFYITHDASQAQRLSHKRLIMTAM